jgi:hypothetical protein
METLILVFALAVVLWLLLWGITAERAREKRLRELQLHEFRTEAQLQDYTQAVVVQQRKRAAQVVEEFAKRSRQRRQP